MVRKHAMSQGLGQKVKLWLIGFVKVNSFHLVVLSNIFITFLVLAAMSAMHRHSLRTKQLNSDINQKLNERNSQGLAKQCHEAWSFVKMN